MQEGEPILTNFKSDIERWRDLPLTLLGRAALFKMITLPQLLYVLQNSCHPLPKGTFTEIANKTLILLWQGRHPRIALKTLQRNPYNGGIALPDIEAYFWASHLIPINEWIHKNRLHPTYRLEREEMLLHTHLHYLYGGKGSSRLLPATRVTVGMGEDD